MAPARSETAMAQGGGDDARERGASLRQRAEAHHRAAQPRERARRTGRCATRTLADARAERRVGRARGDARRGSHPDEAPSRRVVGIAATPARSTAQRTPTPAVATWTRGGADARRARPPPPARARSRARRRRAARVAVRGHRRRGASLGSHRGCGRHAAMASARARRGRLYGSRRDIATTHTPRRSRIRAGEMARDVPTWHRG